MAGVSSLVVHLGSSLVVVKNFSNRDGCGSSLVVMRRGLFLVSVCRRLLSSCGSGCFLQLWHDRLLSTRGKGLLSNFDVWVEINK